MYNRRHMPRVSLTYGMFVVWLGLAFMFYYTLSTPPQPESDNFDRMVTARSSNQLERG